MKMLKYSPLLLLLLSGLFLTGCYTSLASRGYGDKYPDNSAYNYDNTDNNNSYSTQDTTYYDDQGDTNIDNGPYPYHGRFYSYYYPSVAIGFGVGHYYDPFYWDPFIYDGWCSPYYFAYDPFFQFPYWGIGYGGGFHHGHGWNNSGYYKTRSGDGYALRNSGSRGSSYGIRGTLVRGTGLYSRNPAKTRLDTRDGITISRNTIDRTNITSRNNRNNNSIINQRSNIPNVRNRNEIVTPRSQSPNIRNRNYIGRNRQNPIIRDNRNGNRTYSTRGNRPPTQRTYSRPPQRNSSPGHYGGSNSNRNSGSSNRGNGGSDRNSGSSNRGGGGGHSRR